MTGSLTTIICSIILNIYKLPTAHKKIRKIIDGSVILILVTIYLQGGYELAAVEHVFKKLNGLLTITTDTSASFYYRMNYTTEALRELYNNPIQLLTGNLYYGIYTGDGFYVTLIYNYGIFITLYFLWMHIKCINYAYLNKKLYEKEFLMAVIIMVYLFSNRIVDYYPIPFSYIMVFGRLWTALHETKIKTTQP